MDEKFESELLELIESALSGSGIEPIWVLSFIRPAIERRLIEKDLESLDRLRGAGELARAVRRILTFADDLEAHHSVILAPQAIQELRAAFQKYKQGSPFKASKAEN
jgi:hypothetical protein